jgi:hypothetical protein
VAGLRTRLREVVTDPGPYFSALVSLVALPVAGFVYWVLSRDVWPAATAFFVVTTIVFLTFWRRERAKHRPGKFSLVRLDDAGLPPHPVSHAQLPKGLVWLRGVPFFIFSDKERPDVALAATVRPTPQNQPQTIQVPSRFSGVSRIYLLMAVTYGVKSAHDAPPGAGWDERKVGTIKLVFMDGTSQEEVLRLGHDIREFFFGNQPWAIDALRKEGALAFQVWESTDKKHTLDMRVVDVQKGPKDLAAIQIIAQMEEGSTPLIYQDETGTRHDPAFPEILVFGVTCEKKV